MLINKVYKVVVYTRNDTRYDLGLVFGSNEIEVKEEIKNQFRCDDSDRIELYDRTDELAELLK